MGSVFGWPDSNILGMRKLKKCKLWANVFQAFLKLEQYLEVFGSVCPNMELISSLCYKITTL